MEYTRRGHWFLSNQGQQQILLGRIQFHRATRCLSQVLSETGQVIGVFDILDSTFKPVAEDHYYKTGCDPF